MLPHYSYFLFSRLIDLYITPIILALNVLGFACSSWIYLNLLLFFTFSGLFIVVYLWLFHFRWFFTKCRLSFFLSNLVVCVRGKSTVQFSEISIGKLYRSFYKRAYYIAFPLIFKLIFPLQQMMLFDCRKVIIKQYPLVIKYEKSI